MRVRTWAGIAALALALGATATLTAHASPQAAPRSVAGDGIMHIVLGLGSNVFQDFDQDGMGFGDRLIARGPITRPDGRRIGNGYGDCVVVSKVLEGGRWWCRYVLDLPQGQITTEGLDPQGISDVFFSITGGTGDYRDAQGQAEFVDSSTQTDVSLDLGG
jgi:hypothetical protein